MWHPIAGAPSRYYPELRWTPAIELRVRHARWDRPSRHPAAPGVFVDRHVAPDRHLPVPLAARDMPDVHQDPATGAGLALESGEPDPDRRIGGRLYDGDDPAGRHAREWDFLAAHLREALARHHASLPLLNHNDHAFGRREGWRTWEICQAIAAYAVHWKTRSSGDFVSPHPVDVLYHSYHCAGSANIAMALAQVAGIPARRISTSGHSTVEFLVEGRWCWCDNIRQGVLLHPGSYQHYLAGFADWRHHSPGQADHHRKAEVFYRAPYDYSASQYWRFGSPLPSREGSGDVTTAIGLSVQHDPATAAALYPGEEHLFHGDAGDQPWLTIGGKGGWLHAPLAVTEGLRLRRALFLAPCADNPIEAAELRVWCEPDAGTGLRLRLDGAEVAPRGIEPQRHCHHAAVFDLPLASLREGWNAFEISGRGSVLAFPDVVEGPGGDASQQGLRVDPQRVATDPVWMPEAEAQAIDRGDTPDAPQLVTG